jgi:nitroimidazol reductase NimA-like FMN-containing flavoprotein (pyridoxamine 5'-phosphate oxidase superfamily)
MRTPENIREEALEFLQNNVTAVLATCLDGQPHATAIYYDVDDDFNIYFLTKQNTQKNIQAGINSRVALVVGTGPELITAQIRGRAELLTGEAKENAVNRMIVRHSKKFLSNLPIQSMLELRESKLVAYKIMPRELVFMNLNERRYPSSIANNYHNIISV